MDTIQTYQLWTQIFFCEKGTIYKLTNYENVSQVHFCSALVLIMNQAEEHEELNDGHDKRHVPIQQTQNQRDKSGEN